MDAILKKLQENRRLHESSDLEEVTLKMNDTEGQIKELLKTIADYSKMGHSFTIVVDPNNKEYEKKFFIDGDGSDKLYLE